MDETLLFGLKFYELENEAGENQSIRSAAPGAPPSRAAHAVREAA